ncbi:MAG: hypothetical protein WBG57_13715 [Ornithinimicrobium sp.]
MLVPLAGAAADMCAGLLGEPQVFFEVPLAAGVPDMVVVAFDNEVARRRLAAGLSPVVDAVAVRALVALGADVQDVRDLATRAGVSPGHLSRRVLPGLVSTGWVELGAGGVVNVRHAYEPVVSWAVSVEAKRREWAKAVGQAHRHLPSADRVFVALDSAYAGRAVENATYLAGTGVGVVTVNASPVAPSAAVDVVTLPKPNRPRLPRGHRGTNPAAKALLGERAWDLELAGRRTGPTYPVYGRNLALA